MFFYAEQSEGKWLFDGANENRNHGTYYLDNKLPARYSLEDYPSSSDLNALAKKIIKLAPQLAEARYNDKKLNALLKGVLKIKYGSELRLLYEAANLELKIMATHWVKSINRGAIEIRDKSEEEDVYLYMALENGEWRLLACYTGWLSSDAILKD